MLTIQERRSHQTLKSVGTLILDFPASRLWRQVFVVYKPPGLFLSQQLNGLRVWQVAQWAHRHSSVSPEASAQSGPRRRHAGPPAAGGECPQQDWGGEDAGL